MQCYFELICQDAKEVIHIPNACSQFIVSYKQNDVNAFAVSSQFVQKLQSDGYKGVARWYRKVGIVITLQTSTPGIPSGEFDAT